MTTSAPTPRKRTVKAMTVPDPNWPNPHQLTPEQQAELNAQEAAKPQWHCTVHQDACYTSCYQGHWLVKRSMTHEDWVAFLDDQPPRTNRHSVRVD